jgi:Tfp pilus assembly protein PilO
MNQWILQLGDMPWARAFIFAVVAGMIYWFGVRDSGDAIVSQIQNAETTRNSAQATLNQMKKELEDATIFKAKVEDTARQFESILNFMPDDMTSAKLNEIVNEQVGLVGLRAKKVVPRGGKERKDFYETSRVQFELEGTFPQVLDLLSALSRVPRVMTFDSIQIKNSMSQSGDFSPTVNFNAVIVGYRYLREESADVEAIPRVRESKGGASAR